MIKNYVNSNGGNKIPENLITKSANNTQAKKSNPVQRMDIENESDENYMAIAMISMHSDKFRIKARISSKSALKKFKNAKGGEGEVFSVELIDINGDEIRGSFFNTTSMKFFNDLVEGKVYSFENGSIRPSNYG